MVADCDCAVAKSWTRPRMTAWGSSATEAVHVRFAPKADRERLPRYVRLVPLVLQKSPRRLCEIEFCNNRIGASVLLNHCCSFVLDLESMFRNQMPKILLQHNLPKPDLRTAAKGTIRSPRRRGQEAWAECRGRAPWQC